MSSAPGQPAPESMQSEFDAVATWTEQAVAQLGPEYALPAACRGSGSPAALAWLGEALELDEQTRLLDAGSGVGGPAAYAAERFGVSPVLAEPMLGACAAARRLFGFPTVAAWSQALPFADSSFDAVWCLGVLCTTTEKADLLRELRRVLVTQGRLGLLVLVQESAELPVVPDGNDFPTTPELTELLDRTGFVVVEQVPAEQVGPTPLAWQTKADRVEEVLSRAHARDEAWRQAQDQQAVMGRLLREGHVSVRLVHAVAH